MNSANQPPAPHRPTDEQLEERIVAWVAGEASDFEIAALQAAIAARPELAAFKRRIEAVHGLVATAARPDAAPLRLAPDRRAKLLAVLGSASAVAGVADPGKTAAQPKAVAPAKPFAVRLPRPPARPWWRNDWFYSAAACVVISIGGFWMLGTLPKEYEVKVASGEAAKKFEETRAAAEAAVWAAKKQAEQRRGLEADEESEEPMRTVRASDITVAVKSTPPVAFNWSPPPSKSTRSLSVPSFATYGMKAPPAAGVALSSLPKPEVASAYGYTGTTDDGSTGILDKLEVHEAEYGGYAAKDTLAGTRLSTNLNLPRLPIRTTLTDVGSSISTGGKGNTPASDSFLSKRKTERTGGKGRGEPNSMLFGSGTARGIIGSTPAPAAPAVGGEAEEVVVLSPFSVASSHDSGYLRSHRMPKQQYRPGSVAQGQWQYI
jgi:hypothetical protein